MNYSKAFTLIELIVVITIIAVLSGIILFTVTQYINKSKDSNISGNLAILIPAGEVYYNGNGYSYQNFCDPTGNGSVFKNAISQMPQRTSGDCWNNPNTSTTNSAGVCCNVATDNNSWAACAEEFTNPKIAYCVDSRGMKREICNNSCSITITVCPDGDTTKCP